MPLPAPLSPGGGGECDHGKKIGVETPALNGGFVLCCSSGAPPQPPHPATPWGLGVRTGVPRCAKVCDGHGGGVHSWAAVCNAARNRAKPCNAAQCRAKPQSCRTPRGIAALCDVTGSCAAPWNCVQRHATSCNVMQRHAASCNDTRSRAGMCVAPGRAQHSCPPPCPCVPVSQRGCGPFPRPPLVSPCRTAHPRVPVP